jgi:protein-L-isoaspartate(D-aspartate) O-methyltransferase
MPAEEFEVVRRRMLAEIDFRPRRQEIIGKFALDERVMAAMARVPRHEFVPIEFRTYGALQAW